MRGRAWGGGQLGGFQGPGVASQLWATIAWAHVFDISKTSSHMACWDIYHYCVLLTECQKSVFCSCPAKPYAALCALVQQLPKALHIVQRLIRLVGWQQQDPSVYLECANANSLGSCWRRLAYKSQTKMYLNNAHNAYATNKTQAQAVAEGMLTNLCTVDLRVVTATFTAAGHLKKRGKMPCALLH